ncbi:hypothetical protein T10_9907 [Trichinella papuae]|uniref:Uncharacterized protein n=1 Tax=Trichinella papuae TaxID=268474 RepID=A0A0V1LY26_9BILA|nr:hypothetical protein T10_9907 [Trichinella papuae]
MQGVSTVEVGTEQHGVRVSYVFIAPLYDLRSGELVMEFAFRCH